MNYMYIYNQILNDKISKITEIGKKKGKKNNCSKCDETFDYIFKVPTLTITESNIHELSKHNIIDYSLYENIMKYKIPEFNITFNTFNTNDLNIIDGLYEEGSNKIYINKNENIFNYKNNKYSEHYGFLLFSENKLDKIVLKLNYRSEKNDPTIFLPKNYNELLSVDYIFHTHPKTPYIGSRMINSIIYEFPSIDDITHFVEHHNWGKLLGSLVITPEGIYNIRKYIFNRDKIRLDNDIFVSELRDVYDDCFEESTEIYSNIKDIKMINNHIKIPDEIFYKDISTNLNFIKKINYELEKYDITIDFYPRIKLNNKWIFPTIYIPTI